MRPSGTLISISTAGAQRRSARAEAIKEAWRAGETPDAAGVLEANPDLAADRAIAIDLAYEEFCTREECGEPLETEHFCSRFPFGASLRRLIAVHRFLDEHPAFLDAVPTRWPEIGETYDDFQIVRVLGQGGFSRVYLAFERTAGHRPVALKVSAAGSREADTLGPLSHPHLIPVLSSRRVGEWTVVAMPFAGTATIEDVLSTAWTAQDGPPNKARAILDAATRGRQDGDPEFPSRSKFDIEAEQGYECGVYTLAAGLMGAVAYLHDRGLAHRDLKPSNVLIAPTGHPYLLDFNLATGGIDAARVAGTLPYMAPEQLELIASPEAEPPVDWRPADVFACGIILYELLLGRYPFGECDDSLGRLGQCEQASALLENQRSRNRDSNAFHPRIGRAVRAAIERCLDLDPHARPTAAELASLFSDARKRRSRNILSLPTLGTAVLIVAGMIAVFGSELRSIPNPTAPNENSEPETADPFVRGLRLHRRGEFGLAACEFLVAGETTKNGRAYAFAAHCLTVLKDHKLAITAGGEAIRHGYCEPVVFANRAYNFLLTNDLPRSKDDCDEALLRDAANRPARYTRACVHLERHLRQGRPLPPEAFADIESVTSGSPNTCNVWMTAAQLYICAPDRSSESLNLAARAIREAIAAGKTPASIRRNPRLMTALSGHTAFESAMKMEPGPLDSIANPHIVSPAP